MGQVVARLPLPVDASAAPWLDGSCLRCPTLHPALWERALGPPSQLGLPSGEGREGSEWYETQDGLDPPEPVEATRESGGGPFAGTLSLCFLCDLAQRNVTVKRCPRVLQCHRELRGGGVYYYGLTPLYWNVKSPRPC